MAGITRCSTMRVWEAMRPCSNGRRLGGRHTFSIRGGTDTSALGIPDSAEECGSASEADNENAPKRGACCSADLERSALCGNDSASMHEFMDLLDRARSSKCADLAASGERRHVHLHAGEGSATVK